MGRLLVLLLAIGASLGSPRYTRNLGGQPAFPGQFPFIVSLNNIDQFCDGSIINKHWVLTAAHCVEDVTAGTTVLVGTTEEHSGGRKYGIVEWTRHEAFEPDTLKNDIGLIKIDGEFHFDSLVQPVEFIDADSFSSCFIVGWGMTEDEDTPEELHFVELSTLSMEACEDYAFVDDLYLGPEQVCALGPPGTGACFGDSGGPLVYDGKLAGIVSYAISACAHGLPDVYTRPNAYIDWIQQRIKG